MKVFESSPHNHMMPGSARVRSHYSHSAFLSQHPLSSGNMDNQMTVRPYTAVSPRTFEYMKANSRGFRQVAGQFGSQLLQRPASVHELPPLGTPRSRSGKDGDVVAMPRSHVSVARFYDWSEDVGSCFSVSKLYQEIAQVHGTAKIQGSGNNVTTVDISELNIKQNEGRMYLANPGRMFVRDKKALTRGEREIIEGINKNRPSFPGKDNLGIVKTKTQKKAWQLIRQGNNSEEANAAEKLKGKQIRMCGHVDKILKPSNGQPDHLEKVLYHQSNSSRLTASPQLGINYNGVLALDSSTPCKVCQALLLSSKRPKLRTPHFSVRTDTRTTDSSQQRFEKSLLVPPSTPDNNSKNTSFEDFDEFMHFSNNKIISNSSQDDKKIQKSVYSNLASPIVLIDGNQEIERANKKENIEKLDLLHTKQERKDNRPTEKIEHDESETNISTFRSTDSSEIIVNTGTRIDLVNDSSNLESIQSEPSFSPNLIEEDVDQNEISLMPQDRVVETLDNSRRKVQVDVYLPLASLNSDHQNILHRSKCVNPKALGLTKEKPLSPTSLQNLKTGSTYIKTN